MVKSFKHKGLEDFFYEGTKKGIQPNHAQKLADILDRLDASKDVIDMSFPGSRLHKLKGKLKEFWAIQVSGNWRIIFKFYDGDIYDVDYIDYH